MGIKQSTVSQRPDICEGSTNFHKAENFLHHLLPFFEVCFLRTNNPFVFIHASINRKLNAVFELLNGIEKC